MTSTPANLREVLCCAYPNAVKATAPATVHDRFLTLVPQDLWQIAAPLIDEIEARHSSGRRRNDPLPIFAAFVFILLTGTSWGAHIPRELCSPTTLHRRHAEWATAGLWKSLRARVTARFGPRHHLTAWASALAEAADEYPVNPRFLSGARLTPAD